eukprot:Selendium_serpulae@DN5980_c1_g3_i3.p1
MRLKYFMEQQKNEDDIAPDHFHNVGEKGYAPALTGNTEIFVELRNPGNAYFFDNDMWVPPETVRTSNISDRYLRCGIFMEGMMFSERLILGLLSHFAILCEECVPINVMARLIGSTEEYLEIGDDDHCGHKKLLCNSGIQITASGLNKGETKTFREIFEYFMIYKKYIAIGLYRAPDHSPDGFRSYVATNPGPHATVVDTDMVYVIPRIFQA